MTTREQIQLIIDKYNLPSEARFDLSELHFSGVVEGKKHYDKK